MLQAGDMAIREVEINYETADGIEHEYEYERKQSGREKGEIATKSPDGDKHKRKDATSLDEVKRIIESMSIQWSCRMAQCVDGAAAYNPWLVGSWVQ